MDQIPPVLDSIPVNASRWLGSPDALRWHAMLVMGLLPLAFAFNVATTPDRLWAGTVALVLIPVVTLHGAWHLFRALARVQPVQVEMTASDEPVRGVQLQPPAMNGVPLPLERHPLVRPEAPRFEPHSDALTVPPVPTSEDISAALDTAVTGNSQPSLPASSWGRALITARQTEEPWGGSIETGWARPGKGLASSSSGNGDGGHEGSPRDLDRTEHLSWKRPLSSRPLSELDIDAHFAPVTLDRHR